MARHHRGARGSIKSSNHAPSKDFLPSRSIYLIADIGFRKLESSDISPSLVGWKAFGLSVLPTEWTPPYFVISASCFETQIPLTTLNNWVLGVQVQIGLSASSAVMIRSSGAAETMLDRGSLVSGLASAAAIPEFIARLRGTISTPNTTVVHWVTQEPVKPRRVGHLSNERHVSKEPRDWVVELEATETHPGRTIPIGIRSWREGKHPSSLDLTCNSEHEIPFRLRQVAKWATQFKKRIHFEWVWDGRKIWIVQADAAELTVGVDPRQLFSTKISSLKVKCLRTFRLAGESDYKKYIKLRNAAIYRQLGYRMPPFFIIDNQKIIRSLLAGTISIAMKEDLQELLKRPLIIRTEGPNIPKDKREMLPRSDRLANHLEAEQWLLSVFAGEVNKLGLHSHELCIVAHHFIPSVASAWARAQPGHRVVRIESLWGIPEGLYWYSHDTIEVDTKDVKLRKAGKDYSGLPYVISHRTRHKGTFVTADQSGKWTPTSVRPPFDWRLSINKKEWILEIAHTTRRIAEASKEPIALMWFIENHPKATRHNVLPWFHSKSELPGPPRAAPRRKLTTSRDFHIRKDVDWHALQNRLSGENVSNG